MILRSLGSGVYGEVVKCINLNTKKTVAVKILKKLNAFNEAQREMSFLQVVNSINHPNIIRLFEEFTYRGCECLVFELLHRDLRSTIKVHPHEMPLRTIRPIAKQLFMALEALNIVGVIHTDIKLDNIMFVKWYDLRIKVIDFGLSLLVTDAIVGKKLQAVKYRSPEILLGLPYTNKIDMWSAGCVLAHLFLQTNLFEVHSEYEMMRQVVQLLGQPEDRLLRTGIYTEKYFTVMEGADGPMWRLKTPEEYSEHRTVDNNVKDSMLKSLDELVCIHKFESVAEKEDCHGFVDLLKMLLCVNGNKRISASEALNHPFITMSHLMEPRYRDYFNDVQRFMRCCTEMRLTGDKFKDENKNKINSTEQTKVQQQNKKDYQELQSQEQTQKINAWNPCKFPIETDGQEPEDGSKTNNRSTPSSFLQFGKEFMACFTCGRRSSS
ncbi:homeodomain-interacting protein kinase 1-like [Takifugu flavidus]|uniref:homeodomain-interacting protein kinase 1-like n=1 Tax=Takifugu flavidus TaxID=433684 RepID=UPI0025442FD3|nr:homeodomain-interacting protein kinase 1-like [Takifugu flavidus]